MSEVRPEILWHTARFQGAALHRKKSPMLRVQVETEAQQSPLRVVGQVPAQRVAELHAAAKEYVRKATGFSIDASEIGRGNEPMPTDGSEALAFVDHYISTLAQPGKIAMPVEILRLVAYALGVLLGELFLRRFGGQWVALPMDAVDEVSGEELRAEDREALAPLGWRCDLEAAPLRCDPIGMAAVALSRATAMGAWEEPGPATEDAGSDASRDDCEGMMLKPGARHLQRALATALSRLPPVSEEEYYSLTGRFETLCYVVEIIAEIQQRREQTAARAEQTEAT
jgi:hypothetical protein